MAQSISDEEIQLRKRARRRLVGAIALVLVVVIFLPMVLDNEPKPVSQDIAIRIPSQDSTDFTSKVVPIQEKPAPSASSVNEPATQTAPSVPAPADSEPVAPVSPPPSESAVAPKPVEASHGEPVTKSVERTPAKSEHVSEAAANNVAKIGTQPPKADSVHKPESAAKTVTAAKSSHGFVIQLGAFSNMANAKQRQAKLATTGVKFYTETIKTSSGEKLRVRAGPYATRQEADKAQEKLKAAGIADGIVAEKKD